MYDFKMKEIHETMCDLMGKFKTFMSGDIKEVETKEAGEIADIIRDLSETEKNCYEACYYKTVIEAMEEEKSSKFGYNPNRNNMGQYAPSNSYGYKPMVDQEPYIDAYTHGRMGYIDPRNVNNAMSDLKYMWKNADPERRMSLKKEIATMFDDID